MFEFGLVTWIDEAGDVDEDELMIEVLIFQKRHSAPQFDDFDFMFVEFDANLN